MAKKFETTDKEREQVHTLAGIGCTIPEISAVTGHSESSIKRYFGTELIKGRANGHSSLRRMQWQAAQKGNVVMMIWLGKNMLGQADKFAITEDQSTGFNFVKP